MAHCRYSSCNYGYGSGACSVGCCNKFPDHGLTIQPPVYHVGAPPVSVTSSPEAVNCGQSDACASNNCGLNYRNCGGWNGCGDNWGWGNRGWRGCGANYGYRNWCGSNQGCGYF